MKPKTLAVAILLSIAIWAGAYAIVRMWWIA